MELPTVARLEDLDQLDRDLLHVFVLGPGQGEGIALALPEAGWILVDGCRSPRQRSRDPYPLETLVRRYAPTDDVMAMVLTHPHRDHVHGFADLIEELEPRRIAVTGTQTGVRRTLAGEARACEELRRTASTTGARHVAGAVLSALRAIDTWADEHDDDMLVPLCDGTVLHEGGATVEARAPHETILRSWFDDNAMPGVMARRANALSAVLEVQFGSISVVLGGDLPVRDSVGIVPTGWDRVLESHGHLVHHLGMKVPHHGSREALHSEMIGPVTERARAWALTPFNSSSLPNLDEDDGLDQLLEGQSPVMLTAPSVSSNLLRAHRDGRTTPTDLEALVEAIRTEDWAGFKPSDTVVRLDRALAPLAAVWCVAFDEDGIVGRWRGKAALEVHRDSVSRSAGP